MDDHRTPSNLTRTLALVIVIGAGLYLYSRNSVAPRGSAAGMPYGQFLQQVQIGQVISGQFDGDRFDGRLKGGTSFAVSLPPESSPERARLYRQLVAAHVRYTFRHSAVPSRNW